MTKPGSGAAQVVFFPIRHHSPACARAILRAFDEIQPRQVLIEAPVDFEPLIDLIADPETRPPVAIVSLPAEKATEDARYVANYPLCAHSPELVALKWARRNGRRVAFADLPARHEGMRRRYTQDDEGPVSLIAEWHLDHGAYVKALCERRGMPDGLALWDALFESQAGTSDWRGFFKTVGEYCLHSRDVTDPNDFVTDGTNAREAHMIARLADLVASGDAPIAVVTGGFHTPALIASLGRDAAPVDAKAPPPNAYLIRYGFKDLDHFSGYGAGLPHPAYYDRLWRAIVGPEHDHTALATDLLTEFAAYLRKTKPQLAFPTPTLAAAIAAASRLAELRGLPVPGRGELIDAVRSTGIKEAVDERNPLLDALHEFLTGDAIGDLPARAGQPPIVEAVRAQARSLKFDVSSATKRTRELDVLRKPRHAAASRFLFSLDLVGSTFATRIAGPDPLTGWRGDVLFETWNYGWSPIVESNLIARAADGQTLEDLCLSELARRHARLAQEGRARNAAACAELLVAAVRIGLEAAIERALEWLSDAVNDDAEIASIIRALAITSALARPGQGGPALAPQFVALRAQAFERLILLFPDSLKAPEDRLPELIGSIRELAALAGDADDAIDRNRLAEVVLAAIDANPAPALAGALLAFAGLTGGMPEDAVAARIAAMLDGAFVDNGKCAAVLTGCLSVSPNLIVHSREVLAAVDSFLDRIDQDAFLAALPELRWAFSHLTPGEVDRVAGWAAEKHGLEIAQLLDDSVPAHEVAENLELSKRLDAMWRDDGLGAWLGARE